MTKYEKMCYFFLGNFHVGGDLTLQNIDPVSRCCLLPQTKYIQPPEESWTGSLSRQLNIKFDKASSSASVVTITENTAVKVENRNSRKSHGI